MTAPPLRAEGLAVRLGRRFVLERIDLALQPGLLTVIVGPNGAGKTTLLRVLAGLLRPDRGAVWLGPSRLDAVPPRERARTIAYLPQNGSVGWPVPVESVVALGRMPHGEAVGDLPDDGRRAVAAAIGAVGLNGFEDRSAADLSGGERARVLLARAFATEAPVLLADEPVAALDPRHQFLVLDVLKGRAEAGATVVAVMHDLAVAARFADRLVLLDAGRIVADGAPRDVLTPRRLAEVFRIEAQVAERDGALAVTPWRALQ
jgi:iron complex transport system ATP-binding protein